MLHSKYHEHHKLAFRWILIAGAAIISIGLAVIVLFVDRPVVTPVDVEQEDEFDGNLPLTEEQQRSVIERLQLAEESLDDDESLKNNKRETLEFLLEETANLTDSEDDVFFSDFTPLQTDIETDDLPVALEDLHDVNANLDMESVNSYDVELDLDI